jgi:hypothetical protein
MADEKKPNESFLKKINTFFSRYSFKVDDSSKKKSPIVVPLKRDFD